MCLKVQGHHEDLLNLYLNQKLYQEALDLCRDLTPSLNPLADPFNSEELWAKLLTSLRDRDKNNYLK